MKSNLLVGATILTGAVFIAFGSPARAQEASSGDAINGKRAYLAAGCMYCHGRAGQGGAMNYPAPPLAKTELPVDGFKGVTEVRLATVYAMVPYKPTQAINSASAANPLDNRANVRTSPRFSSICAACVFIPATGILAFAACTIWRTADASVSGSAEKYAIQIGQILCVRNIHDRRCELFFH